MGSLRNIGERRTLRSIVEWYLAAHATECSLIWFGVRACCSQYLLTHPSHSEVSRMKRLKSVLCGFFLLSLFSALNAQADGIDTIKSKGVLTVGVVIDPPFGVKNKDGSISGYDVDFAFAIAKKLGVKPVVLELSADERIPALNSHKVDILTATTKTAEREKLVNFSYGYFVTGQKFIAKVGKIKDMNDAKALSIGTIRGTTAEKTIKQELPSTPIVGFADIDEAFQALQQGKVDAVTYDEGMLANKLNKMPNKQLYEISPISVVGWTISCSSQTVSKQRLRRR